MANISWISCSLSARHNHPSNPRFAPPRDKKSARRIVALHPLAMRREIAVLTTTLQSYLLPSSAETPEYRLTHQEFPEGANPEGFKGLAEGGASPAMAVLTQAVEDALAPFGVRLHTIPLTPDALAVALKEAMANNGSYPPGAPGHPAEMLAPHTPPDATPHPAPGDTLHTTTHDTSQDEEAQP